MSPTLGPPGQWVYVDGAGFVAGGTTVEVGGARGAVATVYSPDNLGFTVPPDAEGETPVVVRVGERVAASSLLFRVGYPEGPPRADRLSPSEAAPGTWVYLAGAGFHFGRTTLEVGEGTVVGVLVYSPESLGFTVPAGTEGAVRVRVRTPRGEAEAPAPLRVVGP